MNFRVLLDAGQLIVVDHLGVVEQAADQRTLSVVHATAREETQEFLALVLVQVRVDVCRDKI